jgi:ribonuclease P/MRP protein subunit POP5
VSRPKHLQRRWRYLAVEIESWVDAEIDSRSFQQACWASVRSLLGDAASASLDARVVRFAFADGDGYAIVRTPVDGVERTRAALTCLDSVGGQVVALRVAGVSGTIRACLDEQVPERTTDVANTTVDFDGEDREATRRGDRVDVRIGGSFVGATITETE